MTPAKIQFKVAAFFGLTVEQMLAPTRSAMIVWPRMVAMAMIREKTTLPYEVIASLSNKKDHTTVIYACQAVKNRCETEPRFRKVVECLRALPMHVTVRLKRPF